MNDAEPRWADRIVELREERRAKILELRSEGMTQAQIADALGVAVGTVNNDLTGEDTAPTDTPASGNGRTVPVESLRSGSLPDAAVVPGDDDPRAIADRIMRRQDWRTR